MAYSCSVQIHFCFFSGDVIDEGRMLDQQLLRREFLG